MVRGVRSSGRSGCVYYEATITSTAATASSKTGAPARGLRLGWATVGGFLHGQLGDSDTSIGFDGARQRVYCDARARAAAAEKQRQQQPPPAPPPADESKAGGTAAPTTGQPSGEAAVEPLPTSAAPGGSAGLATPPPPSSSSSGQQAQASAEEEGWDTEGLTGLFVEEDEEEEEEEEDEQALAMDGGRPVPQASGPGGGSGSSGAGPWKVGDVVGCLADLDARSLTFHVNGVVRVSSRQQQRLTPLLFSTMPVWSLPAG